MKVISVYNNKGGVGKTTTTKFFAKHLAKKGEKVLLIDMDAQGNLTSQFLVSSDTNDIKTRNTSNLLLEDATLTSVVSKTNYENIDIVHSHISLLEASEKMGYAAAKKNPATRLKNKLVSSDTKKYDYALIDCPPTMDLLITNALTASDEVIIPINADSYSIDGIEMLINRIEEVKLGYNDKLKISKIFMNCHENTNLHNSLKQTFKDYLEEFSDNTIGKYTIIKTDTLVSNDTEIEKHKISMQFEKLFNEIIGE